MGRTRRLAVVRATNTAAQMAGSVHDDEVARRPGCRGGIVSGVVLYAHVVGYVAAGRWNRLFQGTASIHVASDLFHGGLARIGEPISLRGRVRCLRSERCHRYVDLDVLWLREGDGWPLLHDRHSVIYRWREGPWRPPLSGAA